MHSPWRQPERLLHWRRGQLPEAPEAALLLRAHALGVAGKARRRLPLRHAPRGMPASNATSFRDKTRVPRRTTGTQVPRNVSPCSRLLTRRCARSCGA
jgi:hypothetical protein